MCLLMWSEFHASSKAFCTQIHFLFWNALFLNISTNKSAFRTLYADDLCNILEAIIAVVSNTNRLYKTSAKSSNIHTKTYH